MTGVTRLAGAIAFLIVATGLIGFGAWSGTVASYETPSSNIRADAIIVLTGDDGRLAAGGALLDRGVANQMLISGVHPSVTTADLIQHTGLENTTFTCCVTIDNAATDTLSNARETAQWVERNGYQRLIIVTSDYHLPRSLMIMRATMPETDIIAYPVRTPPPWQDPGAARLWIQEYAKFATIWVGYTLTGQS